MKSVSLIFLLFIISFSAKAQNMVTNGSFEDYTTCPIGVAEMYKVSGWSSYTTVGSPDYFNSCAGSGAIIGVPANLQGSQSPADGSAYIGLVNYTTLAPLLPNYREYVASSISPLTINKLYEVSMSVSLAEEHIYATDGLGAFFFDSGPSSRTDTCLAFTPQVSFSSYGNISDKTGWTRLIGYISADSAYDNIVLGGYLNDTQINYGSTSSGTYASSYYYVDSVVVQLVKRLYINYTNQNLCAGGPISVPFTIKGPTNFFSASNTFTLQLSNASGSFSSPVDIGTFSSTSAGTITGTIPLTTATGSGYRIRIVSSSGADTSSDNGLNITISQYPNITAGSNSPLCEGSSTLSLSATTVTGANYEWNGPSSFYSSAQNPVITPIVPTQSGDYIVSVTKDFCTSYDTVSVVVNPAPSVSITNNNVVCPGTTFQLNATALAGSSFSWTGPGGFTSNIANPSWPNTAYTDAGLYTVVASLNGCSDTAAITMNVQITTATPVSASNSPVCEGYPLNLSATCATPGVTYNWTGPAGYTSTQQNPTQAATMNHNGDFIVKATVNGCVSLPDTVNVQVYPKPYLGNYASPNDTVCEGTVVTFVTVPMNGVTNPSFQWFKNGMAVPGETNLRFVSSYATGDTFYCRTYCQNQCGDNLTLYSNKVGMTVLPVVTNLSVTLSSVPAQALPGNPVTFTATVAGGGYNPQYQWKKNGNDIWGANYAVYSADKLSPYDEIVCCVVSSDPCAVPDTACSDAMVINFPTSVADVSNGEGIMLYPNPNNGSFKVKIQKSKIKNIEVVNVAGQEVYQTQPETVQAEYNSVNLPSQLPAGTYILKVNTADNIFRTTFTIVR